MTFKSLPITYDAIIVSRADSNYQSCIRTLITGPAGTPYDCGCFIFDTYLKSGFPNGPPNVWFLNTGGKRFNPNLYNCGKCCLSILGTWSGDKGEMWNPNISSLVQVYESIQSQILVEQPFFNEPGYESTYNTPTGKLQTKAYNDNIKLYTMQHAMLDLLENPKTYSQFEDIISTHFKLKKNKILSVCEKWTKDSPVTLRSSYETVYNKIKIAIDKL